MLLLEAEKLGFGVPGDAATLKQILEVIASVLSMQGARDPASSLEPRGKQCKHPHCSCCIQPLNSESHPTGGGDSGGDNPCFCCKAGQMSSRKDAEAIALPQDKR